jgi:AcrR family transcriptional regulator
MVAMVAGTRERMIQTAARLFQRDGYCSTSWRVLVKQAGTPWGSIHHHFPGGKEELGIAAIDAGGEAVAALIDHCFSERVDPPAAVARWFALSAELLLLSEYTAGCPVATVALETAASSPAMRSRTQRVFSRWQAQLAAHLRAAGATSRAARDASEAVLALLEGALLLARVQETQRPLRTASAQAQAIVRGALNANARGAAAERAPL